MVDISFLPIDWKCQPPFPDPFYSYSADKQNKTQPASSFCFAEFENVEKLFGFLGLDQVAFVSFVVTVF